MCVCACGVSSQPDQKVEGLRVRVYDPLNTASNCGHVWAVHYQFISNHHNNESK